MGTVSINSTSYEIYGTQDLASDYLAVNLGAAAWQLASGDDRAKALILATRYFDRLRWKGTKTSDAQPIAWPRDSTGVDGHTDGTTPPVILNGFYEMAAIIIEDPSVTNAPSSGSNVQRAKGGEAEVWFFRSTLDDSPRLPKDVLDWIRDYLVGGVGILSYDSGTFSGEFTSVFDNDPEGQVS